MDTVETKLLKESVNEITDLRRQNELMSARLQMFDSMMLMFNTAPNYGNRGMGEDLVWKINKHIESQSVE